MAGSRAAAVSDLRHSLQSALSCVTRAVLHAAGTDKPFAEPYSLTIANGDAVALAGDGRLGLAVKVAFTYQDRSTTEWFTRLEGFLYSAIGADDRMLLAYHWHPRGQSPVTWPHLHLGPAAELGRKALMEAHLPTGLVPLKRGTANADL